MPKRKGQLFGSLIDGVWGRSHHKDPPRKNLPNVLAKRWTKKQVLHDDALVTCIDFAVLVNTSHELVVALLSLDLFREPLFQKSSELVVEVVCCRVSNAMD
jgi:hypothetical protein